LRPVCIRSTGGGIPFGIISGTATAAAIAGHVAWLVFRRDTDRIG
jgi:hypothetical protein